ncbi:hypothetical protein CRM22_009229 [Opisthorchis felineus]|uniref:GST N-terminal domain-containing protein n=1 Tax=Opisthorchis felineus TaxID=147828 RepID=A0A4S2L8F6_OPIFE|nr:hypothetical protein CRM22_009229 [Opisthorchis felineus]
MIFYHVLVCFESGMSKPILYSCYRSSASYRVRIALALKGIDYEYRPINMFAEPGEQFSEEFRKVNPKCELPALQIDGLTLTQSLPIIEYLEETRGQVGRPLLPKDPAKRAVVRKLSEMINSGIQPMQNLSVMRYLPPDVSRDQWAQHWINRGFQGHISPFTEPTLLSTTLPDAYSTVSTVHIAMMNRTVSPHLLHARALRSATSEFVDCYF